MLAATVRSLPRVRRSVTMSFCSNVGGVAAGATATALAIHTHDTAIRHTYSLVAALNMNRLKWYAPLGARASLGMILFNFHGR